MSQALKIYGNVLEQDYGLTQNKNNKKHKRKVKWNGKRFVCTLLIVYIAANFAYWHYKIGKVNAQIESLELKKMALEIEKGQLEEKKKLVQEEKFVEKMARENLGLVKPGEKIIMLAEPGKVMPLEMDENMDLYD